MEKLTAKEILTAARSLIRQRLGAPPCYEKRRVLFTKRYWRSGDRS